MTPNRASSVTLWTTALAVVITTLTVLPFGHHPVGPSVSIVPALVAIVAVFDLMSVYLLLGDYQDRGDLRLAVMAGAYAWSLVVMAGYALAFPGAVAANAPLAVTPSMAPYFYVAWHGSFPVLLAAAWAPWPAAWTRPTTRARRGRTGATLLGAFVLAALVLVTTLVRRAESLPVLINGLDTSRMTSLTAPFILPAVLLSVVVTVHGSWRRPGPERWTSIAVLACLCDLVLTYSSGTRFSLGWYAGRTLTILGAGVVLVAMQHSYRQIKSQAERDAVIDSLTGLNNRRGAYLGLEQLIGRARRSHTSLGVVVVDLDWFKQINDRHGHEAGDLVLSRIGRVFDQFTRAGDLAARMGGEEFLLVLDDTDADGTRYAAERLRLLIADSAVTGLQAPVTASLGTAELLDSDVEFASLLRRADAALYLAKEQGRNQVQGVGRAPTPDAGPDRRQHAAERPPPRLGQLSARLLRTTPQFPQD